MKKIMLAGLFLLFGFFAVSAQNLPTITIVNDTGSSIYYVFISPSDSDNWGEDILENEILENGQTFSYQLPEFLSETSVYDIGMEDEEGDAYFKWELTLTDDARIVFTIDDLESDPEDNG